MNIDEAKRVLEWSQIREDCPMITIEAFEWSIAEAERLQKANEETVSKIISALAPGEAPEEFDDKYENDPAYVLHTGTFGVDCALHAQKRDLHASVCEIAGIVKPPHD